MYLIYNYLSILIGKLLKKIRFCVPFLIFSILCFIQFNKE